MAWRFDAIEDAAVHGLLTAARPLYRDGYISRRLFWAKYKPARDAWLGAVTLCIKWHRDPAQLECVLHG